MPIINRINAMGLRYTLNEYPRVGDKQTEIRLVGTQKKIIVDHQLDRVTAMWYKWQMQGAFIQDAFPEFSSEQREFLMTGITPSEWNEIFKEEDEDNGGTSTR